MPWSSTWSQSSFTNDDVKFLLADLCNAINERLNIISTKVDFNIYGGTSQSPTSWSEQSLSALIPYVNGGKITIEQIKQYAAEQLPCAISNSCRSQASFSATAFWSSVKSAILSDK